MFKGLFIAGFFVAAMVAPTAVIVDHQVSKQDDPYYYRDCPMYQAIVSIL